jgi:hypothetical protein
VARAPLETQIQAAILDYLTARRHFCYRTNNVPVYDKVRGAYRALPKHTPRDLSDIVVVHVGRPYFLEVARPGTYQSLEQKEFQRKAEQAGAFYSVVRSIDDVQALGL